MHGSFPKHNLQIWFCHLKSFLGGGNGAYRVLVKSFSYSIYISRACALYINNEEFQCMSDNISAIVKGRADGGATSRTGGSPIDY